ncbi:hypothetical protein KO528_01395 [Saccharophagus degradans]|uniref:hypothetical protein n=1 Tax=Saccharophagus degradans TaxID=86304 RepID=UPI001C099595|nr:hypothetical protein [Saccharophagus degradans]MBU2983992.1 hypothetical protein [Saccharophagus degradans]
MKLSIGIILIGLLLIVGIWLLDIANDRNKEVKIAEGVEAFNDWVCGYQNQSGCDVVFEVSPNSTFKVKRIRYGKDFTAVKISQDGSSGWVFSGKGVHVYVAPNT